MSIIKYCFDLDNTLCVTHGSDYENSIPIQSRIDYVNALYDAGNLIYIDSARGQNSGIDQRILTLNQLQKWNVKYHILRVGVKFSADIFVDDKGISDAEFFDRDQI